MDSLSLLFVVMSDEPGDLRMLEKLPLSSTHTHFIFILKQSLPNLYKQDPSNPPASVFQGDEEGGLHHCPQLSLEA